MRSKGSGGNSAARTLLMLVLLGIVGYNTYETALLRREVSAMERASGQRPHTELNAEPSVVDALTTDSSTLLAEAHQHMEQAQQMLHLKQYDRARAELTAGTASFERANAAARSDGDRILHQLQGAARELTDRTQSLTGTPAQSHPTDRQNGSEAHGE